MMSHAGPHPGSPAGSGLPTGVAPGPASGVVADAAAGLVAGPASGVAAGTGTGVALGVTPGVAGGAVPGPGGDAVGAEFGVVTGTAGDVVAGPGTGGGGSGRVRLVVLRHAKAESPEGVADHERPLASRGRRDAPAAGRWLRDNGCVPDSVVCSTARRARETWELMVPELGEARPETVLAPEAYRASASDLLELLRRTPAERRTLLLIGHNPGLQDLVLSLAGDAGGAADSGTLAWARSMFPTSAVAVLALPGSWADLAPDSATLTVFAVPRGRPPD